ncbi:hypothetical protein DAETH_48200 (plasmid) [Deinococcus aetherius]|uniref:Uncharacterized protein n=1 Tax=Deinococcus aetherius TaxID=200252 RepID=A0ABN6RNH8_9DEIO|nr:hypothetical protein [Deinococcus aetherius]BDP44851.1 hypothetical protein DAETH_48200 [Deinococcus aetherius]
MSFQIPSKAFVQRIGRPGVQAVLASDHAQDVLIRRPGVADVPARALLLPWSDEGRGGADAKAPEVRSVAWFGLLLHGAPVSSLGFSLVTLGGQVFTPDSPPENAGGADVAWLLRLTPLHGRTRVSTLTFTLSGPGLVTDPETGNKRPASGAAVEVPVRLTATTDPRIRETVGADQAELVLVGRWGSVEHPQARPANVGWGSSSPLELDGQRGRLTLALAWPDEDLAQERQFGTRFLATWRTT